MSSTRSEGDIVGRICEPAWRRHRFTPESRTMVGIGAGLAGLSRSFAARFGLVLAMDEDAGAVAEARLRHADVPNLSFTVARDDSIRVVPDGAVDFCLLSPAFGRAAERETVRRRLREVARMLRPGGLVHLRLGEDSAREAERSIARSGLTTVEFFRGVDGESWALARKPWDREP